MSEKFDDDAVSPVIGMILILAIIMASVAVISVWGIPAIDAAREAVHMQNMRNAFDVLHTDIEEVVRGPITGPGHGRVTRIGMGGGALSVKSDIGYFEVGYGGYGGGVVLGTIPGTIPGTIKYEFGNRAIVYEAGAVFSKYNGVVMDFHPLMFLQRADGNNIVVRLHVVNITGEDISVGGTGLMRVRTSHADFVTHMPAEVDPNAERVTINITSEHYRAWGRYFERELERIGAGGSVTYDSAARTVNIIIDGKGIGNDIGNDIYLSVHETRIVLQVG